MVNAIHWDLILIGTVLLLVFSWKFSIQAKRYHGIARFFAFESLLFLIDVNSGPWFKNPTAPLQIASWFFLAASLYLVIHGVYLLVKLGKPRGDLENTSRLVTTGLYGLIRHPLYASLVYLGLGVYFKQVNGFTTLLAAVNTVALFLTARAEEGEMIAKFGEDYRRYMKATKRFVPFLF